MPPLHLATFSAEVTPPLGHPLCGGWIEPARDVDDPLYARGLILLGREAPIVLCAVDWCGLRNDANRLWCEALAKAAHTTADRVAVHCIHPHATPFADVEAQKLIEATREPAHSLDLKFYNKAVEDCAAAAKKSLEKTAKWTHLGVGKATVKEVASNRRIIGEDGKHKASRTSSTKDPKIRAEPEGLIDPDLRTLSFWDGDKALVAMSFYATHPMSYYGDGHVSADFCGLARQKRQEEEKAIFQLYFTGCAGNVTAGKYNDGAKENRAVLRDRMLTGLRDAWKATKTHAIDDYAWRTEPLKMEARREKNFSEEESKKVLEDPKESKARRNNAAFQIAWLKRLDRAINLACLDLGKALVVLLPGEPFIEYQLKTQQLAKDRFACVAGYGDGGMGYIPTDKAFLEGGYEPTVSLAAPCEEKLVAAIEKVVKKK